MYTAGAGPILRPEVVATVALPVLAGSRDDAAGDLGGLLSTRSSVQMGPLSSDGRVHVGNPPSRRPLVLFLLGGQGDSHHIQPCGLRGL